jgi:alkylhydroperoxidase family enzyme
MARTGDIRLLARIAKTATVWRFPCKRRHRRTENHVTQGTLHEPARAGATRQQPHARLRRRSNRAAFEWTEAVTPVSQTHVPDDVWERVKHHFSDQEIADLTMLIIAIDGWNRIAVSFRKTPA